MILFTQMGYDLEKAFRTGLFQVVSFMTTTGVFSDDVALWPHITWIVLGGVMFVGACAGSTSGGFKCIRAVMTLKTLRNNFRQILHPNAVLPVKINGSSVPQSRIVALFAFFTLFMCMILVTAAIMILSGRHCPELRQQYRTYSQQRYRCQHHLVRHARLYQMDSLAAHAHGSS